MRSKKAEEYGSVYSELSLETGEEKFIIWVHPFHNLKRLHEIMLHMIKNCTVVNFTLSYPIPFKMLIHLNMVLKCQQKYCEKL